MGEIIDKAKGKAKIAQGNVTGDDSRRVEGMIDVWKGRIKGVFEELKHAFRKPPREPL